MSTVCQLYVNCCRTDERNKTIKHALGRVIIPLFIRPRPGSVCVWGVQPSMTCGLSKNHHAQYNTALKSLKIQLLPGNFCSMERAHASSLKELRISKGMDSSLYVSALVLPHFLLSRTLLAHLSPRKNWQKSLVVRNNLFFKVEKSSCRLKTFRINFTNHGVLYYPLMLSHFGPAPVKTDRAVRIQ